MPNMYTLVAPCFFGTEHTLSFEVKRLGAQNVKVTDGRVAFEGDAAMIAAANLNLRTAERVLLLLKTFPAATFDELFDGVYSIPWEELIPVDAQFPVKGSSLSSQLSSVPACQSIVKKAIVKRLQYGHKTTTLPETGALYKIRFALRKNVVEVMLDTSGDGLHKRGYRKNATLAPIKETLAATIADVGFVRRDSTVQDPFCGSGTLVIEAAQKALNIAPGLRRRFAAEHYDFVPAAVWAEERQKALFIEIAQLLRDLHVIVDVVEKLICDIEYIIGIRLATRQLVAHDVYQLDFAVGEAEARERRMLFPRSAANGKAVAHVGIAN